MPSQIVEAKETDKGDLVLFTTGPYQHKVGSLHKNKEATNKQVYVVVKSKEGELFCTRVNKETVCAYDKSAATCVEEAAMKRAKFLTSMHKFAWFVAKYNIELGADDCKLFLKFAAMVEERKALLHAMGEDANWKKVVFKDPRNNSTRTNFSP